MSGTRRRTQKHSKEMISGSLRLCLFLYLILSLSPKNLFNIENKKLFFNRLRPPLVSIETSKLDGCFWKHPNFLAKTINEAVCMDFCSSSLFFPVSMFFIPTGGGGGGHCAPPLPQGILPQISRARPELQTWNFLSNCLNLFWKQKVIFQPPPSTFGFHRNVQTWRIFLKKFSASKSTFSPATYSCSNNMLQVNVWIYLMIMISQQEPSLKYFGSFHAKAHQNSRCFFAISMNSVPNVVRCGNLSLMSRLTAFWWQFLFRTLFCASSTLN